LVVAVLQQYDLDERGVEFIAGWEQFVPWVYDDFAKMVRMKLNGKSVLIPPRWKPGSPVKGTLTFGFGHTDAARHPMKCKDLLARGTDLTLQDAYDILHTDLQQCIADVNKLLKVPVNQSQFDALVSLCFNMGTPNMRKSSVIAKLNRGDTAGAYAAFDLYVHSKGKFMQGLQNRRDAEQRLWAKDGAKMLAVVTPLDVVPDDGAQDGDPQDVLPPVKTNPVPVPDQDVFVATPKAVDAVKAKPMVKSKIGNAQIATGALTVTGAAGSVVKSVFDTGTGAVEHVTDVVNQTGQVVSQVKTVQESLPDPSTLHSILNFLTDPVVVAVIGTLTVCLCAFAWWERRRHSAEGDF
jgi:GH24 family phage-related lysozyme (muramidase)